MGQETKLTERDISNEEYRDVVYMNGGGVYRIINPIKLFMRPGGACHRVVDAEGVVHLYPGPLTGLVTLRWKAKEGAEPVTF